jgi:hypothetical protein
MIEFLLIDHSRTSSPLTHQTPSADFLGLRPSEVLEKAERQFPAPGKTAPETIWKTR